MLYITPHYKSYIFQARIRPPIPLPTSSSPGDSCPPPPCPRLRSSTQQLPAAHFQEKDSLSPTPASSSSQQADHSVFQFPSSSSQNISYSQDALNHEYQEI